jgi:Cu/Ag efflux pump CusA
MMCVVTGRLDNKDLGTVMQTLKEVSSTVILPSGYYIDYAETYKTNSNHSKNYYLF